MALTSQRRDRCSWCAPARRPRLDAYPYAVLPGGRGFIVNTLVEDTASNNITVVLDWSGAVPKH